ncbi:MAG: sodium:calcium antiporter [Candidatus Beckwithbacteria bacterium]|nr:sodium:calcium antiporter [Candidatus Beckwithbacteria bacterium]
MINNLLLLIGFSVLLIKATDIISESLNHLSRITRMGKFAITSFLLAFATSVPELVVGITAALEGRPSLSLGVILGSNIANLSLVIGTAALIGGSLSVAGQWFKFDIFSVFLAGTMPLILLLDKTLSRSDGLILVMIYGIYNYGILMGKKRLVPPVSGRFKLLILKNQLANKKMDRWLIWLFFWTAVLIFSANMIVNAAINFSHLLGAPVLLVGMFLVAVGATLPELTFEARAIKKHQAGMVLGNLTGSIVVNSTLILGLVSLIKPIKLDNGLNEYLLAAAAFGVMFLLFWLFIRSKKKLERWEGLALVMAYFIFALLEWGK